MGIPEMTRSLTIRKRQKAKAPPPLLPEDLVQPEEPSLLAIPYASTTTSSPPVQLAPARIPPNSPSTLCASPPSPAKPMSSPSSSMYPSSTHSTHSAVLPETADSGILAPLPPPGPARARQSTTAGRKRSSAHAATEAWDDVHGDSGSTYEVEAEYELPAYLGPHIIGSERDEDQPAELFAMPPRQLHQVIGTGPIHPVAFSSGKSSQCAETESAVTTPRRKKKRSFWGTFRLGGKQSAKSCSGEEPPPLLSGNTTRHSRLDSNADTIATEESPVTPDAACPWEEAVHGSGAPAKKTNCGVDVVSGKQDERGILDAAEVVVAGSRVDSHGYGSSQEPCHTIVVEIPGDSHFGNDFWARFPRRFI